MTDLPYSCTDGGVTLTIHGDQITMEIGSHITVMELPNDKSLVRLARAVLAAAGDTGHRVVSEEEMDAEVRPHMAMGASLMRGQVALWLAERDLSDYATEVRALPLLSDGGDTDLCAGLAGHTGDHFTADDLRGLREALTRRTARPAPCGAKGVGLLNGPLSCDLVDGHEGDHAEGEQRWENTTADASFDAGWAAGHAHASADQERIAELEKQIKDLSDLVHGHGEDIGNTAAATRGLGKLLREHVTATVDALKASHEEGIADQVEKALEGVRVDFARRPYNAWTDG